LSRSPTLQSLALYARDHFGEDGYPFESSIPSSFDVVAAAYAEGADPEDASAQSGSILREHLENQGRAVAQVEVDEFAREAVSYLRAAYPDAETVRDDDERRSLSHLFWGNLVEARFASGGPGPASRLTPEEEAPPEHTITCSCGEVLTSRDEEELYAFIHAHSVRRHPGPRRALTERETLTDRATESVGELSRS
jgi:hypothetical protein